MKNETKSRTNHPIVSREKWLEARVALLAREKELTRQRDELARQRRALPWVAIDKPYRFEGPDGTQTLADLFRGKSQLIVYHSMLGPNWQEGCPSCALISDHIDGTLVHLEHRDVTLTAVSRAPFAQLAAYKQRMGWRFPWVSSFASDFNHDFHVSASEDERKNGTLQYNYALTDYPVEELPGISVFFRDADGRIYHTYSAYARGCELPIATYAWLDLVPKGRDEDDLAFTMAWVRHHDRYGKDYVVDRKAGYRAPAGAAAARAD